MAKDTDKRAKLADEATDYVLEHGLIGLSLRPLAAAIGTSDRMLLYHFADKDDLVATVLRTSNQRSIEMVRALPPARSVRRAVLDLWAAWSSGHLERCQRLYVEAAALGLFGQEPYAGVVRAANEVWVQALADWLVAAGCPPKVAPRAVLLLDAALMGLHLDLPLDRGSRELSRAVADLADTIQAIANP
ncbi:TetR/AcrR family transcriptional regulator [Nocardioides ultimimeridianus]